MTKRNQIYLNVIGQFLTDASNAHPEQTIQEQWMLWQSEGDFTTERYMEFMEWREHWVKLNEYDQ